MDAAFSGRGLIDGFLRSFLSRDGKAVDVRSVVMASAVPLAASLLWHVSHTTVQVQNGEQSRWLQFWLTSQQHAIKRVRKLVLVSTGSMMTGSRKPGRAGSVARLMMQSNTEEDEDDKEGSDRFAPPKLMEYPASGVSVWTWYGWYPVSIERSVIDSREFYPGDLGSTTHYSITVWFAWNGADIAKKLILAGRTIWQSKRARKTEILLLPEGASYLARGEFKVLTRPSRPLASVIVDGNTKEILLEDTMRFLQGEEWYICKGIPYRRGYLLYGTSYSYCCILVSSSTKCLC